jgi:hypothetical protein
MKHLLSRRFGPLVWSLGACLALSGAAHAQTARTRESGGASTASQRAIGRRVRSFYALWVGHGDPMNNRALIRSYSSRRLARWLYSSDYRDYDADYFLQAQDFDNDWNQAHVRDVRVRGNTARLFATLGSPKPEGKGIGARRLRLKMVKENGLWKIDTVDPVDQ